MGFDSFRRSAVTHGLAILGCMIVVCFCFMGCVVSKYYLLQDDTDSFSLFEDHVLYVNFANSFFTKSRLDFRTHLSPEYCPSNVDSSLIDTYPLVRIDSLSLTLDWDSSTIWPEMDEAKESSKKRRICPQHGCVSGPHYSWGWIMLPDKCKKVTLNFTATLVDPISDSTLESERIELDLKRVHRREVGI